MVESLERTSTHEQPQATLNIGESSRLDEKLFINLAHSDVPSGLDSIRSPFKQASEENKNAPSAELTSPFKPAVLREAKDNRTELVMFKPREEGKIEISEKDFDKVGSTAAKVLRDAGVTKLTMTPGKNSDTYEAKLNKPLEIPHVQGALKLKMGTTFKAEVVKNADGSMTLGKIEGLSFLKPSIGLSLQTKVVFNYFNASIDKVQMRLAPDGKRSEIIFSSGSWDSHSKDNIRTKQAEIIENAKMLFERMEKLKSTEQPEALPPTSFLEIPKLQK